MHASRASVALADAPNCVRHAGFAAHLDRRHFDAIYWCLFLYVVFSLFVCSYFYSKSQEDDPLSPPGSLRYRKRIKQCLYINAVFAAASIVAVVMEVFMLMALQFCDGEDLMSLYWSTWTMIQVGSLIAIFGIMLSGYHHLRGRKHPPWALALGTPVLVVAGLGHVLSTILCLRARKFKERRTRKSPVSLDSPLSMSRAATIVDPQKPEDLEQHRATLLGFTPTGGPILRFEEDQPIFDEAMATYLGQGSNGAVIISFRQNQIVLASELEKPVIEGIVTPPSTIRETPSKSKKVQMAADDDV